MPKILLTVLFLFGSILCKSQDIQKARWGSYYTFIYKITNRQAYNLYFKEKLPDSINYFTNLVQTFPSDSIFKGVLPAGHYLFVKTIREKIQVDLETVNNLDINILNNQRDLMLVFTDSKNSEVKNLSATIQNRKIPFTDKLQAYAIRKTNRQGIVVAEYQGHQNFFQLKRRYNNTVPKRVKRRVLGTFPINHIVSPIYYLSNSMKYKHFYRPGIVNRVKRLFEEKTFSGFIVTNKPMYKPGDTLKMKAYISRKNNKPLSKKLDLTLGGRFSGGNNYLKKIKTLTPYRPGFYEGEFVLQDSLQMVLDEQYYVTLEDKRLRHDYPGKHFLFEEYELKQNTFFANESPENKRGAPATIILKGTDSNDLPLYDAKAEVLVKTSSVQDFYEPFLFIPDTLWNHELKLNPLEDTKLLLPDSIYKNANYAFDVSISFTNAENEHQQKELHLSHDPKAVDVALKLVGDSLNVTKAKGKFMLFAYNSKDENIYKKEIILPYKQKIQKDDFTFKLYKDSVIVGELNLARESDQLEAAANRTSDSLSIVISNPRNIEFRYQLFRGNTVIESGVSTNWKTNRKVTLQESYYLSLQYLWAGKANHLDYNFQSPKKPLSISVNHPSSVFPGQEVDFTIKVKDAMGKPVEDADLTSFSYTRKFKTEPEVELDQQEKTKSRKAFNQFSLVDIDEKEFTRKLNYDFWKLKLGLDSLEFYHFLFPKNGMYQTKIEVDDTITQIAPYVVKDGKIQNIFYIYFDNELKYYHEANESQPYSFRANPIQNVVKLRLQKSILIFPIEPVKGKKLIVSIDLAHLPKEATLVATKDVLTETEADMLSPHFMWINQTQEQRHSWLQQQKNFYLLNNRYRMVGPFFAGPVTFQSYFKTNFNFKSGMIYQFEPGLIDRSTYNYDFKNRLIDNEVYPHFSARVLTEKIIRGNWNHEDDNKSFQFQKYPGSYPVTSKVGSLTFKNNRKLKKTEVAVLLFNLDQPDDYHIQPQGSKTFPKLLQGKYQLAQVFADGYYVRSTDVYIKPFGKTFIDISQQKLLKPDSFSIQTLKKVKDWARANVMVEPARQYDMQDLRSRYYEQSEVNYTGGLWITGRITSTEDGSGLPGVNVIVKGTSNGTVTDANGEYRLYVPYGAKVIVSFIGYKTEELDTNGRNYLDTSLQQDMAQLQEVVVTALNIHQTVRTLSYATSNVTDMLAGKVAGVQTLSQAGSKLGANTVIRIRGAGSMNGDAQPLVLVDGIPVPFDQIDQESIGSIEILKSEQAIALYGARAANGVILISTKKGISKAELLKTKLPPLPEFASIENNSEGSSIRKNFNDYAFWQPKLRTNAEGKASFRAKFPDDITAWNVYTIGVASKGRSGMTQSSLRSFKPLAAQVSLPNFLIEGDTAWAVGKITNYTNESITIEKIATINNEQPVKQNVSIQNSFIDSLKVVAVGDTMKLQYELKHKNYVDGEIRKTPVLRAGSLEAIGNYVSLVRDTTFTLHFEPSKGKVKLYAQADFLDIIEDEIRWLKIYSYDCNEQVASKLRAWLADKAIKEFKGEKFENNKSVEKLIRKITTNQSEDGGWSWWGKGKSSLWISLHVARTLQMAKKLSYRVDFDSTKMKNYLLSQMSEQMGSIDQLETMIYLAEHHEPLLTKTMIDTLQKKKLIKTQFEKLLVQKLLQASGNEVDWKWINDQKKETLKGNYYWGEPATTLRNNDLYNTLIVYSMLEKANPNDPKLIRLKNFFLERRNQRWTNTYQSALIIETILPSLLKARSHEKNELTINGKNISQFPFEEETKESVITINKKGTSPVYFGAYQYVWNKSPQAVTDNFILTTSWKDQTKEKAGKVKTVDINLEVKKDADYVMISVPLPGGYSYDSKSQHWSDGEVHREHDVHETRIYCEHLKAGKYHYEVKLVSRFKGRYTINPAKVEWMYFPMIFGRTNTKQVEVK